MANLFRGRGRFSNRRERRKFAGDLGEENVGRDAAQDALACEHGAGGAVLNLCGFAHLISHGRDDLHADRNGQQWR